MEATGSCPRVHVDVAPLAAVGRLRLDSASTDAWSRPLRRPGRRPLTGRPGQAGYQALTAGRRAGGFPWVLWSPRPPQRLVPAAAHPGKAGPFQPGPGVGLPDRMRVHLDAGYDSGRTRDLLDELGCHWSSPGGDFRCRAQPGDQTPRRRGSRLSPTATPCPDSSGLSSTNSTRIGSTENATTSPRSPCAASSTPAPEPPIPNPTPPDRRTPPHEL